LKKCRESPEDVLFIDASAYFEKAKNQNYLRDEDVEKIISTYRQRVEEDKYSYRAPLAEIAENDFNLNIPRYVDTFEEEEEIDLAAVAAELRQCDRDMVAIDEAIKGFCDELGIDAPL
jgi:type I restriction enzyme M protein